MKLLNSILKIHEELKNIRQTIHTYPELAFEEKKTSELIIHYLNKWDIPMIRGLAKTGVVGIISNGSSKKSIGLRADMDALPIQEQNNFKHKSVNNGKMHACGHDGHTAMLLGAAYYLSKNKNFSGTIYFIFQPAEEGAGGAKIMIEEGLFDKCQMDAVFGMHNWPGIKKGYMGAIDGCMMASSNEFELVINGKGSHAAQPHLGIDPITVAIQIAQSWQTIISRIKNPLDAGVLSITQIHSGKSTNVIPDSAIMIGTVRTFSEKLIDIIEKKMKEISESTAKGFGAKIQFDFKRNYPPLINHTKQTKFANEVMNEIVGKKNIITDLQPTMGSEDFAFMLQKKPGCYAFIGNGDGDHRISGHGLGPCNLHNPSYDFNDEIIPIGSSYWVRLAEKFLSS